MKTTALDIRARYALALVSHTIHGHDIGEEREADVYFEALEMGKDSFKRGDPNLPFLFRDVPFLTRGWKDGFATGFRGSTMQTPSSTTLNMTSQSLFDRLTTSRSYELDLYSLNVDEHGIWVTNPYGVDCALLPMTLEGCAGVIALIEKTKNRIREWACV